MENKETRSLPLPNDGEGRNVSGYAANFREYDMGTNTVACMQSGVFWGYVGLIKECCARIKAEHERPMKVISTGGLAPLFQASEDLFDAFEDTITMHGLRLIHEHNKRNGN